MKKVLIGIAAVVVIIVAVIIAIPFFVPLDTIRDRVVAEVKTATGRDLVIDGPVELSVFPSVAVELSDVSLSNVPGASTPTMITLGQLDVEVGLLPLLSSEIVVQKLILREPVIVLEIDDSGRANWIFDVPAGDTPDRPASASGTPDRQDADESGLGLSDLRLGEVGIIDGTIVYSDRSTGQSFEATNLGLDIELESLDSALALSGGLDFLERRVTFALGADNPRALVAGGESSLSASVEADALNVSFEGALVSAEMPELQGRLSLSLRSVADLAEWLEITLSEDGFPVDAISLDSDFSANPATVKLQTATLTIDDLAASGDLAVALDGERPAVFGRLAVDQLNLDPFVGSGESAAEAPSGDAGSAAEGGADGNAWSDEPIDFSPLMLADADLVIASEGVTLRGVEAGPSVLTTNLKDGVLDFDLSRTSLFGGHIALQLGANAAARTPTVRVGVQMDEVQAEPVLSSFAEFDRLTGATTTEIALTSAGSSQRALVEALDGTGSVVFRDGSIKGFNLAAIIRNITSGFTADDETVATDFAELSATFEITDGTVRSEDIRLLAPLLRIEGAGRAALPTRMLFVRLVSKIVADTEGQGGALERAGLSAPVIIEGPFDDLTPRLDTEGLITNTLGDPGAVGEQLEGVVDQMLQGGGATEDPVRNLLDGLTGGTPQGDPPSGDATAPDPADTLRSLFGR